MTYWKGYSDISNCPILALLRYMDTGKISYLHPLRIAWVVSKESADRMVADYFKAIGDPMYLTYLKKQEQLIEMKYELSMLRSALILHDRNPKLFASISFKYKLSGFKRVEQRCKELIVQIEVKQHEYDNYIRQSQKAEGRDAIKEARKTVLAFSKWMGYHIDIERVTAFEFGEIMRAYNNEMEMIEKSNKSMRLKNR